VFTRDKPSIQTLKDGTLSATNLNGRNCRLMILWQLMIMNYGDTPKALPTSHAFLGEKQHLA
ncbi:hypothetical protein HAX54_021846, partial [Datura stramonium]|nr:hypothetical protein [Datura stramonium]